MPVHPDSVSPAPPYGLSWRSDTVFSSAVAGNQTLYGITSAGKIQALNAVSGSRRWESSGTYLTNRLVSQGQRLFAYRSGEGLAFVDDLGTSVKEQLRASFPVTATTNTSAPAIDGDMVYIVVNKGLYAIHQDQGLQYGLPLSDLMPFGVGVVSGRSIVVINGQGIPTRYTVGATSFQQVWEGESHGIDDGLSERPFLIAGNRLLIGVGSNTVAYDLNTGGVAWSRSNMPAKAFAADDQQVYAAFNGASLWAVQPDDGSLLWQRQYVYDTALQREYGLVHLSGYLCFGGLLQNNPDQAILLSVRAADGEFSWLSRSTSAEWAGGIPITDGERLYAYGGTRTGAYTALSQAPRVTPDMITVTPRPLRGPSSGFGTGHVHVDLPVSARISIAAYREAAGLGTIITNAANWSAGAHDATWTVASGGGYADASQFGYMIVDIDEGGGVRYTQSLVVPVNTFPDILWHWARTNIEIMVYHQYVNGYADQLFRPDNLVTRGESSTIIAKTLNLSAPSPGFQTKFTDIGSHWARNFITALEERGVVGGFLEPDGTYTFRPDLNMTRAQEARILVKAYDIPPAPANFVSRFTDISGHWAAPDIKALEAAGYVSGYQEANGTYTYRPERNLSRAELSTIVVRIRNLTR